MKLMKPQFRKSVLKKSIKYQNIFLNIWYMCHQRTILFVIFSLSWNSMNLHYIPPLCIFFYYTDILFLQYVAQTPNCQERVGLVDKQFWKCKSWNVTETFHDTLKLHWRKGILPEVWSYMCVECSFALLKTCTFVFFTEIRDLRTIVPFWIN